LHALDRAQACDAALRQEHKALEFLTALIDVMIRSFWTFEREEQPVWEARRLRRHLNWYWRREQLSRCTQMRHGLVLLAKKPQIELAGLAYSVNGRRVSMNLFRPDPSTTLQIALLLENDAVFRRPTGEDADLQTLVDGFVSRDHEKLKSYFHALGDLASANGVVVPD
jgi:hypothetical protein